MSTLVDANVLLDVSTNDPFWLEWSISRLREASDRGTVLINPIIYAEFSIGYATMEEADALLTEMGVGIEPIPGTALFSAGKVFRHYRRRGGTRTGVLPDFFIGAHASSAGLPLLTRDVRRYRTYVPDVTLIAPQE